MSETKLVAVAIGKALQIKKRLAGRLAKVELDIRSHNSELSEQSGKTVNVRQALELRTRIKHSLLAVKMAIYLGNQQIQEKLYEFAEKKADIEFYGAVPTHDGKTRHGYQNTEVEHVAILKKADIDRLVKAGEADIDAIQDAINVFNYSTKIEIPQEALDLAS